MPEYDELVAVLRTGYCDHKLLNEAADVIEEMSILLEKIETAPAADVVEVVRCKDCVHRPEAPNGATSGVDVEAPRDEGGWRDETCPYLCVDNWYNTIPQDEWFCHHGERKKNA